MWSRYKVRKVRQIPIVERMWQAIAQQIAAADPKPLRGFGRLSSGVGRYYKRTALGNIRLYRVRMISATPLVDKRTIL